MEASYVVVKEAVEKVEHRRRKAEERRQETGHLPAVIVGKVGNWERKSKRKGGGGGVE